MLVFLDWEEKPEYPEKNRKVFTKYPSYFYGTLLL